MIDLQHATRTIVLDYDQRPVRWDLDKVEIAYLIFLDTPEDQTNPNQTLRRMQRLRAVSDVLYKDFGFPKHEKFVYAQAAEIYSRLNHR